MYTAELYTHEGVTIEIEPNSSGQLSPMIGSYYGEHQILNYSGCDLFGITHTNIITAAIKSDVLPSVSSRRCVQIRARSVCGKRDLRNGYDTSSAKHTLITIPHDLLMQGPIFVEQLNLVLTFQEFLHNTKHPHSKVYHDEQMRDLKDKLNRVIVEMPVALVANDPTGQIRELYIDINHHICAVKVTHFKRENDDVVLAIRDKEYSVEEMTVHRTTFTDLRQENPCGWTLGGFTFSTQRTWLVQEMARRIEKPSEIISKEVIAELIERASADGKNIILALQEKMRQLEDENEMLRVENKELRTTIKTMQEAHVPERQAEIVLRKMQVEETKLSHEADRLKHQSREEDLKHQRDLAMENQKFYKELVTTIGTIVKALAVVLPIAYALYKTFASKPATA